MENNRKEFKVGDKIRNKQTGQEMEIKKIFGIYDFDTKSNFESNRVECCFWKENEIQNIAVEFSKDDIESID